MKDEIIKRLYPSYNPDIYRFDIEVNSEAVKQLMDIYLVEKLKSLLIDLYDRSKKTQKSLASVMNLTKRF